MSVARPTALAELPDQLTYRQLDYWCRQGLIHDTASGSGSVRVFSPEEQRVIGVMARLVAVGISVRLAAAVARRACETAEPGTPARISLGDSGVSIVIMEV